MSDQDQNVPTTRWFVGRIVYSKGVEMYVSITDGNGNYGFEFLEDAQETLKVRLARGEKVKIVAVHTNC